MENAVNAFRVDFDCDIYITGSNAYLLSSEYSTYLSGRCVEIRMLPLSFREFLYFHDFEIRETRSTLGGMRRQAFDKKRRRPMISVIYSMPICGSEGCRGLRTSVWIRRKPSCFWKAYTLLSSCGISWNVKSDADSDRLPIRCFSQDYSLSCR